MSLTIRQWISVAAVFLACAWYVYRIESGRVEAVEFKKEQKEWNEKRADKIRSHEWRLVRVERRLGLRSPRPGSGDDSSWFWQN